MGLLSTRRLLGGYLVAESLVGTKGLSKGADGVSSASDLRRVLDEADVSSNRAFRAFDGQNTKPGSIGKGLVTDGRSPNIDAAAVRRHLRDDHGIDTAGRQKSAVDQLERLEQNWHRFDNLDSSEHAALAARLSKSQDPSATRAFVSELDDVDDVRYLLEETDVATTNRLVDWHANPSASRNIDPDLEANDLVHVARHSDDVFETQLIVKGLDEDKNLVVRWLEDGDLEKGWTHIEARHIEGRHELDVEDATGIFPTGETVKGQKVPKTVSRNDVHSMIYDAIKDGHPTPQGQKTRYYFEPIDEGYPNSGIDDMRVFTFPDGSIETAYPMNGDAILRWVPDLNEGQGGFVDST